VSAGRRARQIAANLERYRWLPRELGPRRIVVNIPAFRLDAYDGGRHALSMRVVVGRELVDRRTPVFSDSMRYVQFGPYWNVPRSIAVEEILPQARRDRSYLERNAYEIVRGWGDDAPVVDPWRLSDAALASPRYRVRQRPGPENALGRVKFMFPNDFAVYLHDTPARALFDERERAYSHGCVRVADPAALAAFVLARRPEWTAARIHRALDTGERVRVELREPIPVYLIYLTAFAQDGDVAFREDRYDMDGALREALGDASPSPAVDAAVARLRQLVGAGAS
jgi:murein L,D-transpeptidase YcbB/YkuD